MNQKFRAGWLASYQQHIDIKTQFPDEPKQQTNPENCDYLGLYFARLTESKLS